MTTEEKAPSSSSSSSSSSAAAAAAAAVAPPPPTGKIEALYISSKSAKPMESRQVVTLIPGAGIDGDRYALQTGTYSAKFLPEPGHQCTIVSADAIEDAFQRTGMKPLQSLGELRRNIVVRGISEKEINNMVGHTIKLGSSSLFVHRRTVPCKYREAQCKRPGLMNNTWGSCGINCEILPHDNNENDAQATNKGEIHVGDTITVVPDSYEPERINIGRKPPSFFIRPADKSLKDVKEGIIPVKIAILFCLIDPVGFQRLEDGYNSVGQRFFSPQSYQAGLLIKSIRLPLLTVVSVLIISIVVGLVLTYKGIDY
jgi:hypothetical protein